ncbi:MAG TPA: hypothetical protein IGS40_20035 [Trichormus sp. M33_DOE_039]|nr:hypothetical protein [Trichormus sp. M33_DOE_039]
MTAVATTKDTSLRVHPLRRETRRHLLQVGKAAQRSVSPKQCLPNALPPQFLIPNY